MRRLGLIATRLRCCTHSDPVLIVRASQQAFDRSSVTAALWLENSAERVAFEQVAELEIVAEHVEALVPAEPLEVGGVDAVLHAGGERAAFEAVAAEVAPAEPGGHGAGLDDLADRPGRQRLGADAGQGRGLTRGRGGAAARRAGTPARR